ncbi:MAG: DNA-3-methyladenine glycosylase [bacterium]
MEKIIPKPFFQKSALELAPQFLGKYLVHNTPKGRLVGQIVEVEAYPAFEDNVSHGNKKTKRTEVMYREGGFAYAYLVYGMHYQFAVVVNKPKIPEVVFIRGVRPVEGLDIMLANFGKLPQKPTQLTGTPANLCQSFGINLSHYGEPIPGPKLWLEDRGVRVNKKEIMTLPRVGIKSNLSGSESLYRFFRSG